MNRLFINLIRDVKYISKKITTCLSPGMNLSVMVS